MGKYLDEKKPMGANVKQLFALVVSQLAIPAGSENPFLAGLETLINKDKFLAVNRQAMTQVEQILEAVKSAPDNPYGDDDELIAAAIVQGVEAKQSVKGEE